MRPSDLDPALLARPHGVGVRVRSVYGETVVGPIPVVSGELSADAGQAVPERLTIRVPARDAGQVWEPRDPGDPLNSFGQRLDVTYLVRRAGGLADVEVPLGQYRIQGWQAARDVVSVEAVGLLQVLDDARLVVPSSPTVGMTYSQAITWLVDDLLPLEFDAALVDEAVSQVVQWDEDRLRAVLDLLDAWGARAALSADGVLTVAPAVASTTPVVSWRDGEAGTVVEAPRSGTRDGIFNAVIARSSATGLADYQQAIAQAAAYDTRGTSPVRWDGPFGQVPYFHASPLIKSAAEAYRAASTILARVTRFAATREVTAVGDPRVELGDVASVSTVEHSGATALTGEVLAYQLPLTAAQGAAAYTVSTMGAL